MKKFYILFLILCSLKEVKTQNSFKVNFDIKDLASIEVKDLINANLSITVAGSNFVIGDYFETKGKIKVFILQLNQSGDVVKSSTLELLNSSIRCHKGTVINNVLYLQVETSDNISSYCYLVAIDLSTLAVNWHTLLSEGYSFRNVKLLKVRDNLFTFYTFNNSSGAFYNQVQKLDLSGNILRTYSFFNHNKLDEELVDAILFNNEKFVLATIGKDTVVGKHRISLHLLDLDFKIEKSSEFKFFNPVSLEINRFGKIELGLNGSNIHLASQEIVGRDGHGKITICMIDAGLALRTWRNYSGELVLEDFNIIPGRFVISGQRPVVNGKEGYAIASINNLNAIPELLSYYVDGFTNFSLASHSFIGSTDSRSLLMVARPQASNIPYLAFAVQRDSASNSCHKSFNFIVTKDPIELNETALLSIDTAGTVKTRNLDNLVISPLKVEKQVLCNANFVVDPVHKELVQYSTIGNYSLIINSDQSFENKMIGVYSIQGIETELPTNHFSNYQIEYDIQKLSAGIYYLVIDKKKIGTFIKY